MTRVRVVTSSLLDQDVESHLAMLPGLPRVQLARPADALPDNLALIIRSALRLFREADADVVVTAGESALVSTMLSWRGPLIHLPTGLLSKTERRLLRWRSARSTMVVTSTHLAATDAIGRGLSSQQLRVIRPVPLPLHATREQIRERLGIDPEAICLLLAGEVRQSGGHSISLRSLSILAFQNPEWRMLIDPGHCADYIARMARSTSLPNSTVLCGQCSASELAAAADVAIVDPDALPSFVSIAAAAAQRVPIIADPTLWRCEQLEHVPALRVNDRKARSWVRAVLEALKANPRVAGEPPERPISETLSSGAVVRQWLEALHTVCRPRTAQVA